MKKEKPRSSGREIIINGSKNPQRMDKARRHLGCFSQFDVLLISLKESI